MAKIATALIQRNADFSADPQAIALPWPGCRYWLELGHPNTAVRGRNLANRQSMYSYSFKAEAANYTRCAEGNAITAPGFTNIEHAVFVVARIGADSLAAGPLGQNRVIYSLPGGGMSINLDPNNDPTSAGSDNLTINNNGQAGGSQSIARYLVRTNATDRGTGFANWTLITFRQFADKTLKSYVKSIDYQDSYSRAITATLTTGPTTVTIGGGAGSGLPVDIAMAAAFDGAISDETHTDIVAMIKARMDRIGVNIGL